MEALRYDPLPPDESAPSYDGDAALHDAAQEYIDNPGALADLLACGDYALSHALATILIVAIPNRVRDLIATHCRARLETDITDRAEELRSGVRE